MEEPGRLQSMGLSRVGHDFTFTFTFHFDALEKEMATHSGTLAMRIPGMAEPDGLQPTGSLRVGHDWSDLAAAAAISFCVTFYIYGVCSAVSVLWFLLFLMSAPSGWVCLRSLYLFPGGRRWCLPTGCWVCQVGRTILRGVSRGGCGLRKTLGSQSAGGWGCVLFVVWVRYPGLGTYGLLGGARSWCQNGRLQNTSHNDNECSLVSLSQVSLFP